MKINRVRIYLFLILVFSFILRDTYARRRAGYRLKTKGVICWKPKIWGWSAQKRGNDYLDLNFDKASIDEQNEASWSTYDIIKNCCPKGTWSLKDCCDHEESDTSEWWIPKDSQWEEKYGKRARWTEQDWKSAYEIYKLEGRLISSPKAFNNPAWKEKRFKKMGRKCF